MVPFIVSTTSTGPAPADAFAGAAALAPHDAVSENTLPAEPTVVVIWPFSGLGPPSHSQALVGITDFQGDAQAWLAQARTWLGWVSNRSGVVMMCHPGWLHEDASDPIAAARACEHEALAGPQWPALLQQ